MNLIEQGFQEASLLQDFPKLESCEFRGEAERGIQKFHCRRAEEAWDLYVVRLIRKEEALMWESFDEVLNLSAKHAASQLEGFYGFEVIALSLGETVRHFDAQAFQKLLINHARLLNPGQSKLVKFTSVYGILKKRIQESFGKIDYSGPVSLYSKSPGELDLFLKKILKISAAPSSGQILIQDLSQDPLFKFGQEEQTSRLGKMLESWKKKNSIPPTYWQHAGKSIELGAQFGMREHV